MTTYIDLLFPPRINIVRDSKFSCFFLFNLSFLWNCLFMGYLGSKITNVLCLPRQMVLWGASYVSYSHLVKDDFEILLSG